jgi:hypothetical protein
MNEIFEENGKQYLARPVISHDDVLSDAIDKCLDIMFRASYPSITLEEYKEQHKKLNKEERQKAQLYHAHYLPWKAYEAIKEDFVEAYELKSQLPEIIDVLKGYFKEPIVDKWVSGKDDLDPGHRGYEHPEPMDDETYKTVEKFMDMANGFYNWNRGINTFYFNISNYSPCSNRETVEKWWHEHGDPDFKLPDDSWWTDTWDDISDEADFADDEEENENE